jgi:hypothetical protein
VLITVLKADDIPPACKALGSQVSYVEGGEMKEVAIGPKIE